MPLHSYCDCPPPHPGTGLLTAPKGTRTSRCRLRRPCCAPSVSWTSNPRTTPATCQWTTGRQSGETIAFFRRGCAGVYIGSARSIFNKANKMRYISLRKLIKYVIGISSREVANEIFNLEGNKILKFNS